MNAAEEFAAWLLARGADVTVTQDNDDGSGYQCWEVTLPPAGPSVAVTVEVAPVR